MCPFSHHVVYMCVEEKKSIFVPVRSTHYQTAPNIIYYSFVNKRKIRWELIKFEDEKNLTGR